MVSNKDSDCKSICENCAYRVVRVLDISGEGAELLYNIIKEEFDEDIDEQIFDETTISHEICSALHLDIGFPEVVKDCSAFADVRKVGSLINTNILNEI